MRKFFKKYRRNLYDVARMLIGILFLIHGSLKLGIIGDASFAAVAGLIGVPVFVGFLVAAGEFTVGILLILGLFSRIAAGIGAIIMVTAYSLVHAPKGLSPLANGGELALVFLAVFLMVLARGDGKWNIKRLLKRKH